MSPPATPIPDTLISTPAALTYWSSIPPTTSGMLGGFDSLSPTDLRGSSLFLSKLRSPPSPSPIFYGVDCGAGIGRVTSGFLSKVCDVVDIVEPIQNFAAEAKTAKMEGMGKVGEVYVQGLEEWTPERKYDLIWNQWCLGHLTDVHLVEYLGRCREGIKERGWLVVKENVTRQGEDLFDEVDSSVTRSEGKFRALFDRAGWRIVREEAQRGFPRSLGIFSVKMFALQPKTG